MRNLATVGAVALIGALAVVLPGALVLRLLRGRSVTVHVCALLTLTVLAVLGAVSGVARAMFLSSHDLRVLLLVVAVAGVVSLLAGWWLGQRMAADAMWADEARARERQIEASRRDLVAWVSHDLRTPLAGLRAMAEALEDGVVSDRATVADYHHRMRLEADRMAGLVDDLFELSRINAGALRLSGLARFRPMRRRRRCGVSGSFGVRKRTISRFVSRSSSTGCACSKSPPNSRRPLRERAAAVTL